MMWKYIQKLFRDQLFRRIAIALWAIPFLVIFIYAVFSWAEFQSMPWLFAIPTLLGALGIYLAYVGLIGHQKSVDKVVESLSEGGELWGIVFAAVVLVVAVPVYEFLKIVGVRVGDEL